MAKQSRSGKAAKFDKKSGKQSGNKPGVRPDTAPKLRQIGGKGRTPDNLAVRLKALRERLGESTATAKRPAADALLVTNRVDYRYLTGFTGEDSVAVVPLRGRSEHVLTDFRFEEQVVKEAPHVKAWVREKGAMAASIKQLCDRLKVQRLAVQADHVTISMRKALVKQFGGGGIVATDDGLLKQRAVKDAGEVREIQRALKIQQQAFEELKAFVKPGMTEFEACAYLEYRMRALGADGVSFPSIVAAGANGSLPHAVPGPGRIKSRGCLLVDWGAKHNGYCSDLTRVIAFGSMPRQIREIYQIVLDAQLAAIDAIRPGVELAQVDKVARDHIAQAGYGERFGHSLGHGIGLDIHEQPVLSLKAKGTLEPGHVVTVEPGIYLPGVGGVRIEDDVLVTDTRQGHRVLSGLPKSLDSAII